MDSAQLAALIDKIVDEVAEVGAIFRVVWDGDVELVDGEVVDVRWVQPSALGAMVATESFVPDVLALVVPLIPAGGG